MYLRPSDIRYSQDSICKYFIDKNTLIGKTLDDICEGRCNISNVPNISVMKKNYNWVTADNRRLWVFKHVERLGKCTDILVYIIHYIPPYKMTSRNNGVSIEVRGNPGGIWHSQPSPEPPPHAISNPYADKTQHKLHEDAVTSPCRLTPTYDMTFDTDLSRHNHYELHNHESDHVKLEKHVMFKHTFNKLEQTLDLNKSNAQQIVSPSSKKPRKNVKELMRVGVNARKPLQQKSTESNHFGIQSLNDRSLRLTTENEREHLAEEHLEASFNGHVEDLPVNAVCGRIRSFEYDSSGNELRNSIQCPLRTHSNDTKANVTTQQRETNGDNILKYKDSHKKAQGDTISFHRSTTESVTRPERTKLVGDPFRDSSLHIKQREDEMQKCLKEKTLLEGNLFKKPEEQRTQVMKTSSKEIFRSQQTITNDKHKLKQTSSSNGFATEDAEKNDRDRKHGFEMINIRRPSDKDGPSASKSKQEKKTYHTLKPSEIRYSGATINNHFKDGRILIGETLDDICEGRCNIQHIPIIHVHMINGYWVTTGNRRLWVFKEAERLGTCKQIKVNEVAGINRLRLTSLNNGTSVEIKGGDPGGFWYFKPTPQSHHPPSASNTNNSSNRSKPVKVLKLKQQSENKRMLLAKERSDSSPKKSQVKDSSINTVIGSSRYCSSGNQFTDTFFGPQRIPQNDKTTEEDLFSQQTDDRRKLNSKRVSEYERCLSSATFKSTTKSKEENRKPADTPLQDFSPTIQQRNDERQHYIIKEAEPTEHMFDITIRQNSHERKKNRMAFPESTIIHQQLKENFRNGVPHRNEKKQQTETRDGQIEMKIKQTQSSLRTAAKQKSKVPGKARVHTQEAANKQGMSTEEDSETPLNFHATDSSINEENIKIGSSRNEPRGNKPSSVLLGCSLSSQQTITHDRETLKRKSMKRKALIHTTAIQTSTFDDTEESIKHVETPLRNLSLDEIHIDVEWNGIQHTETCHGNELNSKEASLKVPRYTTAKQKLTTKRVASKDNKRRVDTVLQDVSLREIHRDDDRNTDHAEFERIRPSTKGGPTADKPKQLFKEKTVYLNLKPSEIRFTKATIGNRYFAGTQRIGEVLDDICEGRCTSSDVPIISVRKMVDGHWYTQNNHRLWIYKHAERLGKCSGIRVRETRCNDTGELNLYNHGTSVKVLGGNPGGSWYLN